MKELIDFLKINHVGVLATVDEGKPSARPWGFMMGENNKLYFCTANTKKVYQQLRKEPVFVFTTTSKDMITVRLCGKAQFTDDLSIKEKVINQYPSVKARYQSADNPIFEVFYIEHGEAVFSDFSGNPPKTMVF